MWVAADPANPQAVGVANSSLLVLIARSDCMFSKCTLKINSKYLNFPKQIFKQFFQDFFKIFIQFIHEPFGCRGTASSPLSHPQVQIPFQGRAQVPRCQ